MKAVICTKYGSPEVLKLIELPKPVTKNNEVLVKIHATSVTSGDVRVRGFCVPVSFWIPARIALGITKPKTTVLGSIFAGEVESVGIDVTNFKTWALMRNTSVFLKTDASEVSRKTFHITKRRQFCGVA
jgi:NADPH:quinone reductase-like Zn-dependent oxidoreductase